MACFSMNLSFILLSAIAGAGPSMVRTVVPTSEETPQNWRYTFAKPADGWFEVEFDDSGWRQGLGGFGTEATPGTVVRTTWNTPDIWLRRDFDISEVPERIALRIHYDEDARVYINGVPVAHLDGYSAHYVSLDLDENGREALRSGKNFR